MCIFAKMYACADTYIYVYIYTIRWDKRDAEPTWSTEHRLHIVCVCADICIYILCVCADMYIYCVCVLIYIYIWCADIYRFVWLSASSITLPDVAVYV